MAEMTAADFRKLADEREAAGDTEGANRARDRANEIDQKNVDEDRAAGKMMKSGGMAKYTKGGMPDLTGDGKVTRADVLKGRGVFKHGGKVPKGMHHMPDGSLMKDSAHKKKVKKKMGGGMTKSYAAGGKVRGDGIAQRGKTKGRMC